MSPLHFNDPGRCPLCGEANGCQLCSPAVHKGPCWCVKVEIPEALLARVPEELRNRACICRKCVVAFHEEQHRHRQQFGPKKTGDLYFDEDGRMVFTAKYLLRRGYCCGSGCRHCPYPQKFSPAVNA